MNGGLRWLLYLSAPVVLVGMVILIPWGLIYNKINWEIPIIDAANLLVTIFLIFFVPFVIERQKQIQSTRSDYVIKSLDRIADDIQSLSAIFQSSYYDRTGLQMADAQRFIGRIRDVSNSIWLLEKILRSRVPDEHQLIGLLSEIKVRFRDYRVATTGNNFPHNQAIPDSLQLKDEAKKKIMLIVSIDELRLSLE